MATGRSDHRQAERDQRVTPLELFFDLVFVFAITQVTSFLSEHPTWAGLLRGLLLLGVLWWAWAEATGARRAALARDVYSYLHLPMVAGIVLFAFGLTTTLHDVGGSLRTLPALGLVGGIALYLLAHVALHLRIGGGLGRGRPVASVLLLGLLPVAREVPARAALGIAAVCVSLIAYEALRHREARAWIHSRRGAFTMEEAFRVERSRRRDRPPGSGELT